VLRSGIELLQLYRDKKHRCLCTFRKFNGFNVDIPLYKCNLAVFKTLFMVDTLDSK
jgi:hypothetical protein